VTARGRHIGIAQHPRDLLHAIVTVRDGDVARCETTLLPFRHHQVLIGMDRNLRQVRDHERLTAFARDVHQRLPHPTANFPADSLIDFVEHERRYHIVRRQDHFQREHQARQLAA